MLFPGVCSSPQHLKLQLDILQVPGAFNIVLMWSLFETAWSPCIHQGTGSSECRWAQLMPSVCFYVSLNSMLGNEGICLVSEMILNHPTCMGGSCMNVVIIPDQSFSGATSTLAWRSWTRQTTFLPSSWLQLASIAWAGTIGLARCFHTFSAQTLVTHIVQVGYGKALKKCQEILSHKDTLCCHPVDPRPEGLHVCCWTGGHTVCFTDWTVELLTLCIMGIMICNLNHRVRWQWRWEPRIRTSWRWFLCCITLRPCCAASLRGLSSDIWQVVFCLLMLKMPSRGHQMAVSQAVKFSKACRL